MQNRDSTYRNAGAPAEIIKQARSQTLVLPGVGAVGWGWLPGLALTSSLGLLVIAAAMARAGLGLAGGELLFWLGIVVLFAPVLLRQSMVDLSRRERIGLIVILGCSLFLVKVLRSPTGFVFHDEFPHWRTANDILQSGHLFRPNPLQPVSAVYPGLEMVTAAIAGLTGLTIAQAGTTLIGVARLMAVLAVYLIYENVSRSERLAGIGAVLYMAYPNFVFWSSQFAYESLAVPLALTIIYSLVLLTRGRAEERRGERLARLVVIFLALLATVTTHHLTSYVLAAFLLLVAAVARFRVRIDRAGDQMAAKTPFWLRRLAASVTGTASAETQPGTVILNAKLWWWAGGLGLAGALLWLGVVGRETIPYLAPHFLGAVKAVVGLVLHEQTAKTFFGASAPELVTPGWERLVALGSTLLIIIAIPFGLLQIWRRYRSNPVALVFGLGGLAFPLTLILRLTSAGSEIGNRALDFLFLAVAFVLAIALLSLWERERAWSRGLLRGLGVAAAAVIFVGGVALGMPAWARLPGSYLVGGDTRAIQPESLALAGWSQQTLAPGSKLIADDTNALLLGSFGGQDPVVGLSWVYLSPDFRTNSELASIRAAGVRYIVVDRRLSLMLPKTGFYFENNEPHPVGPRRPIDPAWLAKFAQVPYLSPVLDSGDIVVYDTLHAWPGQSTAYAETGALTIGNGAK